MGTQNFFLCPSLMTRQKNNFIYFFMELKKLKTYHLSYSIYNNNCLNTLLFKYLFGANIYMNIFRCALQVTLK